MPTEENTSLAGFEKLSELINDSSVNRSVDVKDNLEISANLQNTKMQYITDNIRKLSTEEKTSLADFEKILELINDSSVNTATIAELAKAQEKQILLSCNNSASIMNLNEFTKTTKD